MKKKLFLRLYLTIVVGLSFNSCRQDIPDQEAYNNSGAFQLTSKRISLDEAKHKANLVPKIEQVETSLYAESKNNLQGKTVNFGNGISIDTDDVIYLEKGPDFHSYTFRINHENAPDNAPIENLVISSRPDGTWKEVLVTYYLTPQERQNMLSGVSVDLTGKVTHVALQNGTYSSVLMQNIETCYTEISTYYTRCGGTEDHHNGELPKEDGGPCTTTTPSVLVISLVRKCTIALPASTAIGDDGTGGGSGPQNGPGGLGGGNPDETTTAPNLPPRNSNPCNKIRLQRDDLSFQSNMTNLQGKTSLKKETGYIQRADGQYTYKDNASATNQANELGLPNPELLENKDIIAYFHTHVNDFSYDDPENPVVTITKKGFKIFSPADITYFMDMIKNAQDAGRPLGDVYAIMVSSLKNYQIRFTGDTSQIKTFTNPQRDAFKNPYIKFMLDNESQSLEFKFLKFIDEKMNLKGISLYRMNSDGTTTEIKLNTDKTDTTETNCPQ